MGNSRAIWAGIGAAAAVSAGIGAAAAMEKKKRSKALETDGRGQTVLITGASGGIGRAFVFLFAEHHFDIVAVARSEEKLEELKLEIENSYDVNVTTIVKDLTKEDAAKEIYEELQAKNIAVDQLVNNAGAGKAGRVVDADPETMKELLHLNAVSVTLLCRYFGRDMEERGRGRILNVSSISGFLPDPWFNVYGPTKAYGRFLTETMYGELKGSGVTVTALCPGPTKTGWAENAGKKDVKFAKNADEVAKEGFIAMQRGELVCIPDAGSRAFRCLTAHLPAACQAELVGRWQKGLIGQE